MHLAYKREAVITYLKAKVLDSLLSFIYNAVLSEGSASTKLRMTQSSKAC